MVETFSLPKLSYSLEALEPVISKEIMDLHYNKHHNAYLTNLNKTLQQYRQAEANNDVEAMIFLQPAIRFNGGGFVNHSIFWSNLAPQGTGGAPSENLQNAIDRDFGSQEALIAEMSAKTVAIQGSGWGWLGCCPKSGRLCVTTCQNQDPLVTQGLTPLLGIDVWEHAYYLQYRNVRPEYVKAIWQIVNWNNVSERYLQATRN